MADRADKKKLIQDAIVGQTGKRKILNRMFTIATLACIAISLVPLGSILFEVVKNGWSAISAEFFTLPQGKMVPTASDLAECKGLGIPPERCKTGGIGPAIQGTLIVVGYASLIGIPVGVLTGIYLSEYAGDNKFAKAVRFFNNVMTGLPSIVIGIVGYVILVVTIGSFNVTAGAVALSIIMIPIVVGVTEATLKLVPSSIREAGHSLGIPKWKVTLLITLRSAKNGVLTGIVLGISRIAGETAPLIMTILGTSLYFTEFFGPVDAIPLRIWRLALLPYDNAHSFGWGAALILILMILSMSILLRAFVLDRKGRVLAGRGGI